MESFFVDLEARLRSIEEKNINKIRIVYDEYFVNKLKQYQFLLFCIVTNTKQEKLDYDFEQKKNLFDKLIDLFKNNDSIKLSISDKEYLLDNALEFMDNFSLFDLSGYLLPTSLYFTLKTALENSDVDNTKELYNIIKKIRDLENDDQQMKIILMEVQNYLDELVNGIPKLSYIYDKKVEVTRTIIRNAPKRTQEDAYASRLLFMERVSEYNKLRFQAELRARGFNLQK